MTITTLPDGKNVLVSCTQEAWWSVDGATGYVPPQLLIPDPNQPRKIIGGSDWPEFVESVKTSGVRELIRVTPRALAPWVVLPERILGQFVIVSGHRRHKGATEARLEAVPIIIRVYASETAYREDADELNTGRKDLTPLEEAIEIKRRYDAGDSLDTIAKKRGMSTLTCSGRLKLLNLAPEISELIDPTVRQGKRSDFPINVASALGTISDLTVEQFLLLVTKFDLGKPDVKQDDQEQKLDYAIQRMLLKHIEDHSMSAPQAIEFIKSGRRSAGHGRSGGNAAGRSASKTMLNVKHVLEGPIKATTTTVSRPTLRAACTDTSTEQLADLIATGDKSIKELTRLNDMLRSIHDARPRAATGPSPLFTPAPTVRRIEGSEADDIAARYGATMKRP